MKSLVLVALAATACGSGNIASLTKPTHCAMSSIGAVNASLACNVVAASFSIRANAGGFSGSGTAPGLVFRISLGTNEQPDKKTYENTSPTVIPGTGVSLTNSSTGAVWSAVAGSSGAFSLTVNSLNDSVQVFGGGEWPAIDGALTATLEPENSAASGTVTITATFQ
jgi:hypothetical protein